MNDVRSLLPRMDGLRVDLNDEMMDNAWFVKDHAGRIIGSGLCGVGYLNHNDSAAPASVTVGRGVWGALKRETTPCSTFTTSTDH